MSTFVFIFRNGMKPGSPKEMQEQFEKWGTWFKKLRATGKNKGGDALASNGVSVRQSGRTSFDGAYPESKDLIGGYTVIEADTLEAAVALTEGCPAIAAGGAVEVRPVFDTSAYM